MARCCEAVNRSAYYAQQQLLCVSEPPNAIFKCVQTAKQRLPICRLLCVFTLNFVCVSHMMHAVKCVHLANSKIGNTASRDRICTKPGCLRGKHENRRGEESHGNNASLNSRLYETETATENPFDAERAKMKYIQYYI